MLTEALEGDCLFCVGRLTGAEVPEVASGTAPVGTAGLIRASREQPDGRSELILHGVCRVSFTEWLTDKPYPYASISPIPSPPLTEAQSASETRRLREAVEATLLGFPDEVVSQVRELLERSPDPAVLSDAVSQQFVQDSDLRQTLLEELDVTQRIDTIIAHLRTLRSQEN